MDGIHDLGGKQGFGPVPVDPDAPLFPRRWEARTFAMAELLGTDRVTSSVDAFRHAIERMAPEAYLTRGYYGRWLASIETLLDESGHVPDSVLREAIERNGGEDAPVQSAPLVPALPEHPVPGSTEPGNRRAVPRPPAFSPGDRVVTASHGFRGHTRLPAYARGRTAVVLEHKGGWAFPDSRAHGRGDDPQHLYGVEFEGRVLWGDDAEPGTSVVLDLFEPYIRRVQEPR